MLDEFKNALKLHVKENDLETALTLAQDRICSNSSKHNELIVLYSMFLELESNYRMGIISFGDFIQGKSKIALGLLSLSKRFSSIDMLPNANSRDLLQESIKVIVECAELEFDICMSVPYDIIVISFKTQIISCLAKDLKMNLSVEQHRLYALLDVVNGSPLNENLSLKDNKIQPYHQLRIVPFIWE